MAEYTYVDGVFSILRTVLENSGFFDIVATGDFSVGGMAYSGVLCSTNENSEFFKFGRNNAYGGMFSFIVNQGATPSYEFRPGEDYPNQRTDYYPLSTYATPNGVSIVCSRARILITRNQNGKVVVVTGANPVIADSTTDYIMGQISAIAETDNVPFIAHTINTAISHQTYIMPICTMSSALSYTDKAGVLAYKQNTAIGNILYNGKRYFSDGYFAIEDEEETT